MSSPRLTLFALLLALVPAVAPAAEIPMYIGTYATKAGGSQGIYLSRFNTETGAISAPQLAVGAVEPSFLVQHPTKKLIYAVDQTDGGCVSAYAIEADGKLHWINRQPSLGKKPTHLAIDREGRNVLVANYTSGSIACLPVAPDGSLKPATGFIQNKGSGTDPKRQEGPHAHSIYVDRANKHVYSADLGLDRIMVYRFNPAEGSLEPADPPFASVPPGSGSRHLAFSANDDFIYCVNELNSTVTAFARKSGQAVLEEIQTITTLPADFKRANNPSEIWVHPNGKFLYATNRGLDSIVAFNIAADGKLTYNSLTPTEGKHPRYFCFDPPGKFIICGNMMTDSIMVFKVDGESGKLTPIGAPVPCYSPSAFLFTK